MEMPFFFAYPRPAQPTNWTQHFFEILSIDPEV